MTLESVYEPVTGQIGKLIITVGPVTNAQYAECLRSSREVPPPDWFGGKPPSDSLDHPVVDITLAQARRYAEWSGQRLPTHLEWEAVARWPDGRRFPWGDAWAPDRCHGPDRRVRQTSAVGLYPNGQSDAGCHDLVGNVWEWTEIDPRGAAPQCEGSVWVYGGSYLHPCEKNGHIARTAVSSRKSYPYLGFRCVRDA